MEWNSDGKKMESFWRCNSLTAPELAHLHAAPHPPVTLVNAVRASFQPPIQGQVVEFYIYNASDQNRRHAGAL